MQSDPLVSIIMPAYNAERYIAGAVQSVIDQSWKNWELIIVNDGSTDGTDAYLETLENPRIQVLHRENGGVSKARNEGLDLAKGEYVTFIDADDVLPAQSLECRVKYLNSHRDIDVAHGIISIRNEELSEEITSYKPFFYEGVLQKALKLDSRLFFNPCYLIRHEKIGQTRFLQGMTHCEDILFLIHFFMEKPSYAYIDETVYYYRTSNLSAMSNMQGLLKGYFDLIENVMRISTVNYADTLIMRLKVARIFTSWHLRNRDISGLLDVPGLFKIGVNSFS